jgi:hypothetical protein
MECGQPRLGFGLNETPTVDQWDDGCTTGCTWVQGQRERQYGACLRIVLGNRTGSSRPETSIGLVWPAWEDLAEPAYSDGSRDLAFSECHGLLPHKTSEFRARAGLPRPVTAGIGQITGIVLESDLLCCPYI